MTSTLGPFVSTRSFSPESAACLWMCNTWISSTKLCFRDWVQLAQIYQAPLCRITWHEWTLPCYTHPAAVIQARDQKLVSSNGRSNTIQGQCGALCPKTHQWVCVRFLCVFSLQSKHPSVVLPNQTCCLISSWPQSWGITKNIWFDFSFVVIVTSLVWDSINNDCD